MRLAGVIMVAGVAGALAVIAGGCGAGGAGDDAGDDSAVDAGGSYEDAYGCAVGVIYNPANPVEGETVTMTADVPGGGSFFDYHWTVNGSDEGLTLSMADGSAVRYTFDAPGTYAIGLQVDGTDCLRWDDVLPVRALGATDSQWRLRFTASPVSGAPPQELVRNVPSGADWDVGDISLDPGAAITGRILDGSGAGVAAYLRLVPAGTPDLAIDAFAGSTGSFAVNVTLVRHDVLIIPFRADLAPRVLRDWSPLSGDQLVDTGTEVTGTVVDPSGAGVVGATVTLRVGGVPSSVGTTVAGGAFSVRARPAASALVEVVVVPPDSSGLPRLSSSPAVLDLGNLIDIEYAPALASRDVAGTSVTLGGASATGAEVTFTGSIASAGLVKSGLAQATAAGSFAIAVDSNGSGVLPSALIPAVAGIVVVEPATGTPGVVAIDLTAAVPATLAAPAAAVITGRVVDATATAVDRPDLRAIPTGALAAAGVAEVHRVAAVDGSFTLPLAAGGSYALVVGDRNQDLSLLRTTLVVTGTATLADLVLPDGLHVGGRVTLAGSGTMIGTAVTLFCESCPADQQTRPAAESATDIGGRFRATVLDPGTE